jgi:hypothetical protein
MDSIDANNEIARQDAQGVRAASGTNVSLVSHGNVMTLEDGVQCASTGVRVVRRLNESEGGLIGEGRGESLAKSLGL